MKLYSYPKCSTCRSAIKLLREREIDFEEIDISKNPPSLRDLRRALQEAGGEKRKIFNTSGQSYRKMGMSDRIGQLSDAEALDLLRKDGMLIKRPMLFAETVVKVGFKQELWNDL